MDVYDIADLAFQGCAWLRALDFDDDDDDDDVWHVHEDMTSYDVLSFAYRYQ